MLQREKTETTLKTLLGLWHGDRDSTGWASPVLAYEIARCVSPPHARALGDAIYPPDEGKSTIPSDVEIIEILNKGYKLWKGRK